MPRSFSIRPSNLLSPVTVTLSRSQTGSLLFEALAFTIAILYSFYSADGGCSGDEYVRTAKPKLKESIPQH